MISPSEYCKPTDRANGPIYVLPIKHQSRFYRKIIINKSRPRSLMVWQKKKKKERKDLKKKGGTACRRTEVFIYLSNICSSLLNSFKFKENRIILTCATHTGDDDDDSHLLPRDRAAFPRMYMYVTKGRSS